MSLGIALCGAKRRSVQSSPSSLESKQAARRTMGVGLALEADSTEDSRRYCKDLRISVSCDLAARAEQCRLKSQHLEAKFASAFGPARTDAFGEETDNSPIAVHPTGTRVHNSWVVLAGMLNSPNDAPMASDITVKPDPPVRRFDLVPYLAITKLPDAALSEGNLAAACPNIGRAEARELPSVFLLGLAISIRGAIRSAYWFESQFWFFVRSIFEPLLVGTVTKHVVYAPSSFDGTSKEQWRMRNVAPEVKNALAWLAKSIRYLFEIEPASQGHTRHLDAFKLQSLTGAVSPLALKEAHGKWLSSYRALFANGLTQILAWASLYKTFEGAWAAHDASLATQADTISTVSLRKN